jgi:Flp pilus assembly protein TadD
LLLNRQQRRAQLRRHAKRGALSSTSAEARFASALEHHRAGRLVEAEAGCRATLEIAPAHVPGHDLLAFVLCQQGRYAEAEPLLRRLVGLKPGEPATLQMLGIVLHQLARHDEARQLMMQAIELRPTDAECHSHLAAVLAAQGRMAAAVSSCAEACRLEPDDPIRHYNLGNALHADRRHADAAESFRAAIRRRPDFADAYSNLGVVLREMGDCAGAIAACRHALELVPDDADVHANLGHWLLLTGRLEEGWQEHEWRLKQKPSPIRLPNIGKPQWRGENIGDRILLLHAEQGFGDTIQFCRYVPLAAARARVVLVVPRPLVRLLSSLHGVERIIPTGDPLPAYDLHCPLMSLAGIFGTSLDTIPAPVPYLKADPGRVAAWRQRSIDVDGFGIGLVWAGNPRANEPASNAVDRRRSIALDRLAPLASVPGVTFISLQKGEAAAQIGSRPAGMVLHDWTQELDDFAETAALVETLDLVISVDTAVAHLAGSLGKPVWLLNRFDTCWRWLLGREDSPWYPTLRQFRQPALGDWDGAISQLRRALEMKVRGDVPPAGRAGYA